jgi:hypothetical protein
MSERNVRERSPEAVNVAKLGAIEHPTVHGKEVLPYLHLVARQRDDLFQDRAAPASTAARREVAARAPQAFDIGR